MTAARPGAAALLEALERCGAAMALPGQPEPLYRALEDGLGALYGHKIFSIMLLDEPAGEAARVWSSRPEAYPVGGRKPLDPLTDWGRHVLGGRRSWLGRSMADIRWAFPDHETIAALGCGCCVNLIVIWDGRILGTINMLHEEGRYAPPMLDEAAPFARLAVPGLLRSSERR